MAQFAKGYTPFTPETAKPLEETQHTYHYRRVEGEIWIYAGENPIRALTAEEVEGITEGEVIHG